MSILSFVEHGVSLLLLLEVIRLRRQRRLARHPAAARLRARVPVERLPDSVKLAGIPLRVVLSDRSGPGSVLRDTHMIRPYGDR